MSAPHTAERLAHALHAEVGAMWDLLHRSVAVRLLVSSQQQRFLPEATDELEAASERLRLLEVGRSAYAEQLASDVGLPTDATLTELLEALDAPTAAMIEPVAAELVRLQTEVTVTCTEASGHCEREVTLQARSREQLTQLAATG